MKPLLEHLYFNIFFAFPAYPFLSEYGDELPKFTSWTSVTDSFITLTVERIKIENGMTSSYTASLYFFSSLLVPGSELTATQKMQMGTLPI